MRVKLSGRLDALNDGDPVFSAPMNEHIGPYGNGMPSKRVLVDARVFAKRNFIK